MNTKQVKETALYVFGEADSRVNGAAYIIYTAYRLGYKVTAIGSYVFNLGYNYNELDAACHKFINEFKYFDGRWRLYYAIPERTAQ